MTTDPSPATTSEQTEDTGRLVALVAEGDHEAFARLYDVLAPIVYGVTSRVLQNRANAEEVTHDVFVHLWRHAAGFDSAHGSAGAWAARIARHRAGSRLLREPAGHRGDHLQSIAAFTDDSPDGVALDQPERDRARRAVERLEPEQRQALQLAFYGAITHTQIAELLDIPLEAVTARIRTGLHALRPHGTLAR